MTLITHPTPALARHDATRSRRGSSLRRAVFLVPAGIAMLAGLDAALMLLGVAAPVSATRLPHVHGMLLVFGFVGTLISLERSVALHHPAGFLAPGLFGAGGILLLSPVPLTVGKVTLLLGAIAMVGLYIPLWRRQRDDAVLIQTFGAVVAIGALALWVGGVPVSHLLPWLTGFIVLTIGGERLELARIAMGPTAGRNLLLLMGSVVVAIVSSLLWPTVGYPLLGLSVLVLVAWLAIHDIARVTIKTTGLTRFMAGNMLGGYLWLGIAGGTWAFGGPAYDGARYDVVIHAVFLGFTLSMIMAHAPVILPAVLRKPLPYHPALLAPAILLHLSLALRLWFGDALEIPVAWQIGGVLNVVALLGFVVIAAWSATRRPRVRSTQ